MMSHTGDGREKAVEIRELQSKGEFAETFPTLRELHGALTRVRYEELLGPPEVLPKTCNKRPRETARLAGTA